MKDGESGDDASPMAVPPAVASAELITQLADIRAIAGLLLALSLGIADAGPRMQAGYLARRLAAHAERCLELLPPAI